MDCTTDDVLLEEFEKKSCRSREFGHPNKGLDNSNTDLSGRPILYTGVIWVGVLRRFLIPRPVTDSRPCCQRKEKSDLEVQDLAHSTPTTSTSPESYNQSSATVRLLPHEFRQEDQKKKQKKEERKHSQLAVLAQQIKEASTLLKDEAQQFSDNFSELVQDGKATTSETLHTLREDEGVAGRYGAITITSLLGYMAGMRRGVAVRLVYAATGAVATATICCPDDARYYNDLAQALLREGVVLSVQILKSGLQKTLVVSTSDEEVVSTLRYSETIPTASHSEQRVETETIRKNNAASQETNVGGFEQDTKQTHLSSNSEQNTLQQNLAILEQQEITPGGSPTQFAVHEGRLSRECHSQRDVTRVLPYSPALPVPPEIEHDCFQNSNTYKPYIPNTNSDGPLGTNSKENANLRPNSLHGSRSSLKVKTSHSDHEASQHNVTNPTKTEDGIPEFVPVEEVVTDSLDDENFQNYPLNKKLSRYYTQKKYDTVGCAR